MTGEDDKIPEREPLLCEEHDYFNCQICAEMEKPPEVKEEPVTYCPHGIPHSQACTICTEPNSSFR